MIVQRLIPFSVALLLMAASGIAMATDPAQWLQQLNDYPHAVTVDESTTEVIDHEVGLGRLKKIRGVWEFRDSERLSGELTRHTWQIVDGFTSAEVMQELEAMLGVAEGSELLFGCEGRACGKGVQWANRIFRQRVLYGREDLQRYRVYRFSNESEWRVLIYASARTADRQYLHVEVLQIDTADE